MADAVKLGKKIATGGSGAIYLCKLITPMLRASAGGKEAIAKISKSKPLFFFNTHPPALYSFTHAY